MDPEKTTDFMYLFTIIEWYAHYRGIDTHKHSLWMAKEKAASMWSSDNMRGVEVSAEYLTKQIDKLLRGVEHEA